jgi:uncharacterized protein (DUF362 family)/NAD-dependent dihydropyrimidine dehydrogenase PreA subunit
MPKVAVVKCDTYEREEVAAAVRQAVEALGVEIASSGEKVLLKPNFIEALPPEASGTTHPEVVRALVRMFKEKGATVFIGDSSRFGNVGNTNKAFEVCGATRIAKEEGVELVNLEADDVIKETPERDILQKIYPAKTLEGFDRIISIPKLKTHMLMKFSGSAKNLVGCIPGGGKALAHAIGNTPEKFASLVVALTRALKPTLAVMDGVWGMEGNGPVYGEPKKLGLIFASENPYALDWVASGMIGYEPREVDITAAAIEEGELVPEEIEIIGEKDLRVDFIKPTEEKARHLLDHFLSRLSAVTFAARVPRPTVDKSKCTRCGECVEKCPEEVISLDGRVKIDYSGCIYCYYCMRVCPEEAITLTNPRMVKFIKRVLKI